MVEGYAYIPIEEQTRNKLRLLKRELSYDAFIKILMSSYDKNERCSDKYTLYESDAIKQ